MRQQHICSLLCALALLAIAQQREQSRRHSPALFIGGLATSAEVQARACPATPFQSTPYRYPGLTHVPWVKAQPAAAGITGHLFRIPPGSPWRTLPLRTGGGKILWRVNRETQGVLEISARNLSTGHDSFRVVIRRASGIDYPSGPVFPTPGCWKLTLRTADYQNHVTTATVVFMVVR